MDVIEVNSKLLNKAFIGLPRLLYKNDPNFISPLDNDIEAVFNPERNNFFKHGVCTRWLLKYKDRYIGRIAAFIDFEKSRIKSQPTGGIGFFECIQHKEAAFKLFDTAITWLKEQGIKAVEGPINFGENDKYWGLLVEGFKPPSLSMNYNPPFYQNFFESYGFVKEYDQYTNFLDASIPMPERFTRISDWVMRKPGYTFEHFDKKQFDRFAADFQEIYNDAWSTFQNFTPLEMATIKESFRQMEAIMDPKIIWFAYHENKPVAFILCLPDVNQILKHVNGKLDLIGKLKFLYYKKTTVVDRLRIIIMGCKKKYQQHGMESALIRCLQNEVLPRNTIKGVELAWVGDFNQKMIAIHEATGAVRDKVHRTYKYKIPE
jgi:hypothetical protein